MVIQGAGDLGGSVWTGLAPILATAVAAGVTWLVQKTNGLVGGLKGYAAQVAAVVVPAALQWFSAHSGFSTATAETFAASFIGWLAVHLGVHAASVNPQARA